MTPEEFVETLKPYAKTIYAVFGIHWRAILAQAALETGWLRKPVTDLETGRNSYNLFNIKGEGPAGSVRAYDEQYINGRPVRRIFNFRAYHNYEESFEDYARLITESPRYQSAMAVAEDPEAFVYRIQQAGYAEDPRYAQKLIQIMRKYIPDEEEAVD
ncbi:MAG TPA: hypothetical protein GXZ97_01315 [Hydrogenispora sp.]|nr:hypothetical protein [Hydrogenispora sp.]